MNKHLPILDALRGIAVMAVIVVHTAPLILVPIAKQTSALQAVGDRVASARMGVELFFLLSGFLMGWLYSGGQAFSAKKFLISRFLRIWPLWALFSLVWFGIFAVRGGDFRFSALLLSLGFFLWTSPVDYDSFIGGAWSIQIEVVSYALFAGLNKIGLNALVATTALVNVLSTLTSLVSLDDFGLLSSLRRLSLQTGLNFFTLGIVIAVAYLNSLNRAASLSWIDFKDLKLKWLSFWLISFLFAPAIYGNPIEAIGFILFCLLALSTTVPDGPVRRTLAWLGRYSYFLFFAHFVALEFLAPLVSSLGASAIPLWVKFACIPLVPALLTAALSPMAWVSMRYFEAPILRLKQIKRS